MFAELDTYDWEYIFDNFCTGANPVVGDTTVSTGPFRREDVVAIFGHEEGENDGPPWELFGFLRDGRYFVVEAGCDYTGWG